MGNIGAPLRLLLVVEPGVDGVFRHVEGLAHFLLDQPGVVTHLAYSSIRGGPGLTKLVSAVAARGGQTLDLRVSNAPRLADARAFARLWRLARAVHADVIHAHSSKAGALTRALALVGIRARYFYTPHAYYQMHGEPDWKKRFFVLVERLLGGIGTTLHVSASEAEYARRALDLSPARQRIALNGVDGDRFHPARSVAERRDLRATLELPIDALLLGTVARLSLQKDPLTLYRALLQTLEQRPDLHFVHLNAVGELADEIERLLQAAPVAVRARIHQRPAMEEPAHFYRALDAFVLPSRYEGLALAAMEALSCGLPLILTDCPGNTDLHAYPFNRIWWSPPEDPSALSQRMIDWADAAAGAAVRGLPLQNNHREIALVELSLQRQFKTLMQFYQACRAAENPADPNSACHSAIRGAS